MLRLPGEFPGNGDSAAVGGKGQGGGAVRLQGQGHGGGEPGGLLLEGGLKVPEDPGGRFHVLLPAEAEHFPVDLAVKIGRGEAAAGEHGLEGV